jgi:uroporphyrinogen III methyltransferase/synthase
LPRAEIARKALVDALKKQGAFPDEVAIYRTLPTRPDSSSMTELQKGVDIATFTSSSTVNNFFDLFGENTREILKGAVIACIGPITAETARTRGLNISIVAADYTIDGLIEALLENQQIPSGTIQ